MGKGRNDYLRVGKVEKTEPKIGRNTETPTDGSEHRTKLAHINVFRISLPGEASNIAPIPPVGGHTLARVCVWVAIGGHQADIITSMGLPAIQMLNDAQLKRCHIGTGNGRGNWNNRRNDGSGGRMRKHPEAEEKMTQKPGNNTTME